MRSNGAGSMRDFWACFEQGIAPLPFGPALATDLYAGYRAFCISRGARPAPVTRFIPWAMLEIGIPRIVARIPRPLIGLDLDSPAKRKPRHRVRVMLINHRSQANKQREHGFMLTALRKFRRSLDAWEQEIGLARAAGALERAVEAGEGHPQPLSRVM